MIYDIWKQKLVPNLHPNFHNLTEAYFQDTFNVGLFAIGHDEMVRYVRCFEKELLRLYRHRIYAYHYNDEKHWIQQHIEYVMIGKLSFIPEDKRQKGSNDIWK